VSIIRAGKVVETGTLADLRHLTRTQVSFQATDASAFAGIPQAHDGSIAEGRARFTVDSDEVPAVLPLLAQQNVTGLRIEPPSLEELFLRHYGDDLTALRQAEDDGATRASRRAATKES
jgi:ABC-2 type transport system ATP-binding protein